MKRLAEKQVNTPRVGQARVSLMGMMGSWADAVAVLSWLYTILAQERIGTPVPISRIVYIERAMKT